MIISCFMINCSNTIKKTQLSSKMQTFLNKSKKIFQEALSEDQESISLKETILNLDNNIKLLESLIEENSAIISEIEDVNERSIAEEKLTKLKENIKLLQKQRDDLQEPAKKEINQIIRSNNISEDSVEKADQVTQYHEERQADYENTQVDNNQNNKIPEQVPISDSLIQKTLSNTNKGTVKGTDLTGTCLKSFLSVIPPTFCYKKGADAGKIPTRCSDGYFRSMALCYEHCRSGYNFVLGVCWESCRSGYKDMGLTCFKWNWFKSKSYWKDSYMSKSYTNFDGRVGCEDGMYKGGALCYRDCSKIYLVNCGIGACAASSEACTAGIITMVVDVTLGAIQFGAFIATFGASSAGQGGFAAGKQALKTAYNAVKSKAKYAFSIVKKIAQNNQFRKKFLKEALDNFTQEMSKFALDAAVQTSVNQLCTDIGNGVLNDIDSRSETGFNAESFDVTGISSAVSSCDGDLSSSNAKAMCAKGVLDVVSNVDPTGLVAIASGLIQETCDV